MDAGQSRCHILAPIHGGNGSLRSSAGGAESLRNVTRDARGLALSVLQALGAFMQIKLCIAEEVRPGGASNACLSLWEQQGMPQAVPPAQCVWQPR